MADAPEREGTLTDRLAVAFLSAVSALLLGGLVWIAVLLIAPEFAGPTVTSFRWVLGFTIVMAVLGFLLLDNLIVHVLATLMRWLSVARWW